VTHIAERYLDLFVGDDMSRKALLACAAAHRWDDESAREAIALVAESNGSTEALLRRIKSLGCVWQQWDGTWYLTEEVRTFLAGRLDAEVAEPVRRRLREALSAHTKERLASLSPDGAITVYRVRTARIESAYQKALIPGREQEAGGDFEETWQKAQGSAKPATCDAVARIGDELEARGAHLPDEVLFLRGMSAYQRRRSRDAEKDFRGVYQHGRAGTIYAIAAHLLGRLVRDRREAKRVLHRSIVWDPTAEGRAQSWHSLGNLLSKDRQSWLEAENAYHRSLALLHDPEHQGQVWHSFGNLLSKDQNRWAEAENAYRRSLALRHDPEHQGQVKASWADALIKVVGRPAFEQAEGLALEAQSLDPRNPHTCGIANRVLAKVYEERGQISEAIAALEALQETDRQLGKREHRKRIQDRIDKLRRSAQAHAEA
jgi:tetratricopeptide (TPR) repeat protein